ncbi:hypothetical protein [Hymenobacter yonginensis]|uniref:Uncharacterized protein n=1 Tax=Hymenobacter yonginensis TaxID=748197 RepID=A0ABY7PVQ4_9BACT|nr:hypothetical protein [Hymenobacter yonginensis]WBO86765.1 hypothetical protein O9Z63_21010 [Hymenobacter yonginensis]
MNTFLTEGLTIPKGHIVNSDTDITNQIRKLPNQHIRPDGALLQVHTCVGRRSNKP